MFIRKISILAFIIFILLSIVAFGAPQAFTGTVTDTMCGKKHMMPGKTAAECTRECMKAKGNWTYGLVVADKVYSLSGDNKELDRLAGKRVRVLGELTGSRIAVQTIRPVN